MQIRTPAVAGMFYQNEKKNLEKQIDDCFSHLLGPERNFKKDNKKIFGIICPHAGFMYSGPIACHSFFSISNESPELFIIVGPNHWGIGRSVATMKNCQWETPLGRVEVDSDSAEEICQISKKIESDFFSHTREHSLEVQIPFLQKLFRNFKILPISLINQNKDTAIDVGLSIAKIASKKNSMIIGSSDFTHYEPNQIAYEQDSALIKPILEMNIEEFYEVLEKRKVTACGYGAIASTIIACKELGAKKGELLKYATSGDVTGDESSVVGYGSIVFT